MGTLNGPQWIARLKALASSLTARGAHVEISVGNPIPADEIESEEAFFGQRSGLPGFRFDPALRTLYIAARSVRFGWQAQTLGDTGPLSGAMKLAPLAMLYETDPGAEAQEPWFGIWRTFDRSGPTTEVVIKFDVRGTAALAWRSTEGGAEEIIPLELSVDEYLELSLAACCLNSWPLLFAEDRGLLEPDQIEELFVSLGALSPPGDALALRHRHASR